ncbi:MAG: DUF2752 domain-containing protein [bacterium]|nr:DUF2752 domain-containing protein [bacterium]
MNFVPETSPWPRLLVFPFLAVSLPIMGMARWAPDWAYKLAHCPLRDTTGIPCLTCGGTHSLVSLVDGHWIRAFQANPLIVICTVLFFAWSLWAISATVFSPWRKTMVLSNIEKRTASILTVLSLVGNWIWEFFRYF